MFSERRGGIKLIEVIVATLVLGALLGLYLRAQHDARAAGRRLQCSSNQRQVGLGLIGVLNTRNSFPNAGTIEDDPKIHGGDPMKSTIYRSIIDPGASAQLSDTWLSSWVVDIIPYIDMADNHFDWNHQQSYMSGQRDVAGAMTNAELSSSDMGLLRCPEDPTGQYGQGNLSYVVNGGFARWHAIPIGWKGGQGDGQPGNGEVLQWTPAGQPWQETQAICRKLGVMFLGTRTGDQPWDIKTTSQDISDGTATTLLGAENTLVGFSKGTAYSGGRPTNWACPLPNFCMFIASDDVCRSSRSATDCLGGQLRRGSSGDSGPGWILANKPGTFKNIGYGQNLTVEGSFPFANGAHSGGANFLFCDGAVRFLTDTMDGTLYAEMITPAGHSLPEDFQQRQLPVWDYP